MKTVCNVIFLFFLSSMCAFAQSVHAWEEFLYDINGVEEYDETALDMIYERLCELEENPRNINSVTVDELMEIPGLTMDQISDIIEYRDRYGELKTMEELSMVTSIDYRVRLFLSHFFVASPLDTSPWYEKENLKRLLENGHGNITATLAAPFYEREGDKGKYYGDKYKYGIKLTGHFADYIKYGVVASKDAGEPVFSHGNKWGMDYYSFFLSINNYKRFKNIMLGRYRMRMGMGLVLNNNYSFGKQSMLSSAGRSSCVLTGHASRSDADYFQGIATTIDVGKHTSNQSMELTIFYSYRNIDATLNDDGTISTVLTSGYHRTQTEMAKKNNSATMSSGAHLSWKYQGWFAGASGVYNWYNRDLAPKYSTEGYKYRKYNARGNEFWNASVDYGYNSSRLCFSGETATGSCGALATLNVLQWKPLNDITLMAVQRFYSYKYYALYSNAFSDGGNVHNESGAYLGMRWQMRNGVLIDAYTDYSYSPWLKYQISASSHSWDNCISSAYNSGPWNLQARYRLRLRQRNNSQKTSLADRTEHRGRLSSTHTSSRWILRTQADWSSYLFEEKRSFGWMLSQSARCQFAEKSDVSAMIAYFNTSDYDTRLYVYERSMLNTFSMPSFYGKGIRISSVCRYDASRHLMLMGKIGFTRYFDRDTIGTGLRVINASYQMDADIQVRYTF